jgi:hypothetical protein
LAYAPGAVLLISSMELKMKPRCDRRKFIYE